MYILLLTLQFKYYEHLIIEQFVFQKKNDGCFTINAFIIKSYAGNGKMQKIDKYCSDWHEMLQEISKCNK